MSLSLGEDEVRVERFGAVYLSFLWRSGSPAT